MLYRQCVICILPVQSLMDSQFVWQVEDDEYTALTDAKRRLVIR